MNIEKMQLKGQLAEARKKYKSLDTEASGLIILIRALLNPYEDDICSIETDKALKSAERLNCITEEMKTLRLKIKKMEEGLE